MVVGVVGIGVGVEVGVGDETVVGVGIEREPRLEGVVVG